MPVLRRRRRSRVQQTQVGSVPCFWAAAPPPFAATLVFRVGRVDESLRTSGLTHLVEHLVMPARPPTEFERNARVEAVYAVFWATGRQDEVLAFLTETCAMISEPPLERIDVERRILKTESFGRSWGPIDGALTLRYGATGPGIVGYDELALSGAGAEAARSWLKRLFTAGNAACWMTSEPPRGFALDLPAGERVAPPEPASISDLQTPAVYAAGPPAQVSFSLEVERSTAISSAFNVLRDRAWRTLRYERGLAYEIGDWYEPLTATRAHGVVWVDSLEENLETSRDALLALADDLSTAGPTRAELDEEARLARRRLEDPQAIPGELHATVTEWLLGRDYSLAEIVERKESLTADDVSSALAAARGSMLLILPEGVLAPEGFAPYPMSSSRRVEGRKLLVKAPPISKTVRRTSLVLGDEGVSLVLPDGVLSTVLFDECEVMLQWPDGSRTLHGRDGFRIEIEPSMWRNGRDLVAALDDRLADRRIVMDPATTGKQDRVEAVAQAKLKRRWVISEELEALPRLLADDEQVLTLAEANRGWRAGMVVVTDRRFLWFYRAGEEHYLDVPRDDVLVLEAKRGMPVLGDANLKLRVRGEELELSAIVPRDRATEIAGLLRSPER